MTFSDLKKFWLKIKDRQQAVFNFLVLHVVYFVGIGVTAVFAKIVKKNFLQKKYNQSSWQKSGTTQPIEPTHMF